LVAIVEMLFIVAVGIAFWLAVIALLAVLLIVAWQWWSRARVTQAAALSAQTATLAGLQASVAELARFIVGLNARVARLEAVAPAGPGAPLPPERGDAGTPAVLPPEPDHLPPLAATLVPALVEALRASIKSVLGYSDLLARGTGLSEGQLARYLNRLDASLASMQVMLDNLLVMLEIDSERAALAPQPVDVLLAVDTAVGRARAQLDEKTLAMHLAIDRSLPRASADPRALAQIIDNLLLNAARRSPQGGDITVSATLDDVPGAPAVVISVHDRGAPLAGPPAAAAPRRADSAAIGLTVVRLLAERQGGRSWTDSDVQGTQFNVQLPVRPAA
jgi:signal transduction histidine kinase